jgi:hypothetical protein
MAASRGGLRPTELLQSVIINEYAGRRKSSGWWSAGKCEYFETASVSLPSVQVKWRKTREAKASPQRSDQTVIMNPDYETVASHDIRD